MPKFILLFALLFTPQAKADDLWLQVDQFIGQKSLCEAFIDSAEYQVDRETCSFSCDKWRYTIKTFCSTNPRTNQLEARIEYWNHNKIFSETKISPHNWAEINGNLLRGKAQFAASNGANLTLISVQSVSNDLKVSYKVDSSFGTAEEGEWLMKPGPAIYQGFIRAETSLLPFKETRRDSIQTEAYVTY